MFAPAKTAAAGYRGHSQRAVRTSRGARGEQKFLELGSSDSAAINAGRTCHRPARRPSTNWSGGVIARPASRSINAMALRILAARPGRHAAGREAAAATALRVSECRFRMDALSHSNKAAHRAVGSCSRRRCGSEVCSRRRTGGRGRFALAGGCRGRLQISLAAVRYPRRRRCAASPISGSRFGRALLAPGLPCGGRSAGGGGPLSDLRPH